MTVALPLRRRRVVRVALAVATFVVALELVLQLGAFAVWALQPTVASDDGPPAAVLCVGDSYTWGIGSSARERAYPAALAAGLAALGLPVGVRNGGSPGQDSAHVLRELPRQLRPSTKVVCVLLGTNDSWSWPERVGVVDELPAAGFSWRWRTGRLLDLLLRFRGGVWQERGNDADAAPRQRPELLDLAAGFALLEASGFPTQADELPVLPPPLPDDQAPRVAAVETHLANGESAAAFAAAASFARELPAAPHAARCLALAAVRAGETVIADAALQRLAAAAADGDELAAEVEIRTLIELERLPAALAAARIRLQREPRAILARQALLRAAYILGDWVTFRAEAPVAIRQAARLSPREAAPIGRQLARVIGADEPAAATALVVASAMLDGDAGLTRAEFVNLAGKASDSVFEGVLSLLPAGSPSVPALRTVRREALGGEAPRWTATLRDHLVAMHGLVSSHGARMVMLTYPFHQPEVESVQRAVAAELSLPIVEVRLAFDRLVAADGRARWFVPDGHCNDAGYARIAELAAPVVAAALRR